MALSYAASSAPEALANLELLRQRLHQALYAKKERLRELVELCKAQRAELRGWIQQRRVQALAELRDELRRARSAAAAARRTRLQEARRSARSSVDVARAAVEIERAHAADQLAITRAHGAKRVAIDKAHARSLSDDHMSAATLKRLGPLVEKAGKVRPAPGESRTEALWRYAHAHPEEMHAILEPKTERIIAQTRKEIASAEEAIRTGAAVPAVRSVPTPGKPPTPPLARTPKPPPRLHRAPRSAATPEPSPRAPAPHAGPQRASSIPAPIAMPQRTTASTAAPTAAPKRAKKPQPVVAPPVVRVEAPPPIAIVAPAPALPSPEPPPSPVSTAGGGRRARAARPRPQLGLDFSALQMTPLAPAPSAAPVPIERPPVSAHSRPSAMPTRARADKSTAPPLPVAPPSPRPGERGRTRAVEARPAPSRAEPDVVPPGSGGVESASSSRRPPGGPRSDDSSASIGNADLLAPGASEQRALDVPKAESAPLPAHPQIPPAAERAHDPMPLERARTEALRAADAPVAGLSASYDPGDNKLRLRSVHRLDPETYKRVKAAGFGWAPKQDLFVAPAWTPQREDLLLELCGEIDDEDTSLVDRAEVRAVRFEDYSEKRGHDAEAARKAVAAIADHIPLGQPILVGHHSERHARRDAAKIESGMRKAVGLWKRSTYWQERAKAALRSAKYKERPDVRHRRIKGLESDRRKQVRTKEQAAHFRKLWSECTTLDRALEIANVDHLRTPDTRSPDGQVTTWGSSYWSALKDGLITLEAARARAVELHKATIGHCDRWIEHLDHRLAYESAMLDEGGGIAAAKFDLQVGGQILDRFGWSVILRVNKKGGAVASVTVAGKYGKGVRGIEEIRDYRPPAAGDTEKVAKATKLPPLVNFPGDGFRRMTQAEWDRLTRASDFARARRVDATDAHGAYRLRMASKEGRPYYDTTGVYVTDGKRVDPPAPGPRAELPARELHVPSPRPARPPVAPEPTVFDAMAQSLEAGVQVVAADQLFPTPPELAARVASLANFQPGQRVLEPSAGTGRLLRAALAILPTGAHVVAVEIREDLVRALAPKPGDGSYSIQRGDFLALGRAELGTFDCVIMNPPFANGADVRHILHARALLKPGGRLVAVCADGPRQREALRPLADTWEELAEGTFKASGTNVRTVLLTMGAS